MKADDISQVQQFKQNVNFGTFTLPDLGQQTYYCSFLFDGVAYVAQQRPDYNEMHMV